MPNKKTTIDDLARMVQAGFLEMKTENQELKKDIKNLQNGQEQIILRLDKVAYRFELVALTKRVKFLEHKLGIKPT